MKKIKKENQKPKKAPFIIYPDLECLLEKTIITLILDIQLILNVHLMIIKIN